MSDVFEGPGWWMASDGKWYPPERHPDASYRERFAGPVETPTLPAVDSPDPEASETPDSHARTESTPEPEPEPEPEQSETYTIEIEESAGQFVPEFSESRSVQSKVQDGERPRDHPHAPQSAREVETTRAEVSIAPSPSLPDIEPPPIEYARPASVATKSGVTPETHTPLSPIEARDLGSKAIKTAGSHKSTSLVRVKPEERYEPPTARDRIVAGLIFLSGVTVIIGTFITWTTASGGQTGWERGDGLVTVVLGIIGSGTAGPIWVGYRHIAPKAVAIVCGLGSLVTVALVLLAAIGADQGSGIGVGVGLYVVLAAAIVMVGAALVDRGDR